VFDSGYPNKGTSEETVEEVRAAIMNMERLEEERQSDARRRQFPEHAKHGLEASKQK